MLAVIQGPPLSPLTLRRVSLPVYCLLALNSHATDSTDEKGGLCLSQPLASQQSRAASRLDVESTLRELFPIWLLWVEKSLWHLLGFPLPAHRACELPSALQSSSLLANLANILRHLQNYSDLISSMKDPLILPRKISLFLLSKNLIPWVHHHECI